MKQESLNNSIQNYIITNDNKGVEISMPSTINANGTTDKNGVTTYTSSKVYDVGNGFKITLDGTFIDDPRDNQLTLLLSTDGSFIPSGMIKTGDYWTGQMLWPSTFQLAMHLYKDNDSYATILKAAPTNTIQTIDVSETMGYSVGGSIEIQGSSSNGGSIGGSGGINGSFSASKTISYKQPDYQTILKVNDSLNVLWDITFNRNKEGYDRDSWNVLYGNQLFMRSRTSYTGIENLTLNNDLSSLITGGFSPKGLVAIKRHKNVTSSNYGDAIKVELTRFMDKYDLNWATSHWKGTNTKNYSQQRIASDFVIDWQNHQLR